jgi:hypothetical protein
LRCCNSPIAVSASSDAWIASSIEASWWPLAKSSLAVASAARADAFGGPDLGFGGGDGFLRPILGAVGVRRAGEHGESRARREEGSE